MTEPMTWGPERRARGHVAANVTVAVALLTITAMGVAYVLWGAP